MCLEFFGISNAVHRWSLLGTLSRAVARIIMIDIKTKILLENNGNVNAHLLQMFNLRTEVDDTQ